MARQRVFHGVLATVGGVVLLESLFLPWYRLDVSVAGIAVGSSQSAWQSMTTMDVLLLMSALAAVAGGVSMVRSDRAAAVVLAAGAAGVCLSLVGLIDVPEPDLAAARGDTVEMDRRIGPFLALVASGSVVYGATRTAAPPAGRAARRGAPGRSRPARRPPPRPR